MSHGSYLRLPRFRCRTCGELMRITLEGSTDAGSVHFGPFTADVVRIGSATANEVVIPPGRGFDVRPCSRRRGGCPRGRSAGPRGTGGEARDRDSHGRPARAGVSELDRTLAESPKDAAAHARRSDPRRRRPAICALSAIRAGSVAAGLPPVAEKGRTPGARPSSGVPQFVANPPSASLLKPCPPWPALTAD